MLGSCLFTVLQLGINTKESGNKFEAAKYQKKSQRSGASRPTGIFDGIV